VLTICDGSDLSETISLETVKDLHVIVMDFSKSWKNLNDNIYVIYLASVLFSMLKTKWFTRILLTSLHLSQCLRVLHFPTSIYIHPIQQWKLIIFLMMNLWCYLTNNLRCRKETFSAAHEYFYFDQTEQFYSWLDGVEFSPTRGEWWGHDYEIRT